MQRLFINKSNREIDAASQERVLVNRANVRISVLHLQIDERIQLKPTIFEDLLEFFFILEGEVEVESGGFKVQLAKGEYFYTHNLRKPVLVATKTDTYIFIASNISITKQMNIGMDEKPYRKSVGGGLYIMGQGCISRVSQDNNALSLLASGGGLDIMMQEIFGDRPGCVTPGDVPDLLEFFYIVNGSFYLKDEADVHRLDPGDSFYVYDLDRTISFSADDGAKAIYIASKPIFDYLLDFMADLNKLLRQYEEKDVYTHNHSIRVEQYSLKIASRMGLPNDMLLTLAVASLFHDIGKVNIPDEILNKAGRLSELEFEYIKHHPSDSVKMLSSKFEEDLTNIVEQHHERLDGSGYPKGLKGDEIMLEAKIVAVADAFDAMTSDRAYRKAMSHDEAMDELRSLSAQYDGYIVETLGEILQEENKLMRNS